jgi:hypothetical protein
MSLAVIYARVSSRDQEREGFSIPAQLKLLREYAASHNFRVVQEFVDVETAKATGRKQFGEMIRFLGKNKNCHLVLVEKTDRLTLPRPDRLLDAVRILELANKAYSLYLTRTPAEQAKLLRIVLSNCSVDAVNLYPTYRKPFDLILKRVKTEEWSGREDSNLRPPGPEPDLALAPKSRRYKRLETQHLLETC